MTDPFSIALGALTLAEQCASTVSHIYSFFSNSQRIDVTLSSLAEQINALANVLTLVSNGYASAEARNQTSHTLEAHWKSVHEAMENCRKTLTRFRHLLDNLVIMEGQLFWRVRVQAEYVMKEAEIAGYQNALEGFCRVMQISLGLLNMYYAFSILIDVYSEANFHGTQNVMNRIESLEVTFFTQFTKVQADITRQFEFIQNKLSSPSASAISETTLASFVQNILDSTESARSVVEEVRSNHSQSAVSQIGLEDIEQASQGPPSPCDPQRTFYIGTSVADAVNTLNAAPEENIDLWVINAYRTRAKEKLAQKNYAEAYAILQTILRKSEQKFGNLYEWKDDTIRMLAITQCRMHRWREVEEVLNSPIPFTGMDEVRRMLVLEYCAEGKMEEALKILSTEFEGRDKIISDIVAGLCREKRWAHAVKFAKVDFVGRETPLEMVATGCQQSAMWKDAAEIWREVLNCKLLRNAPTSDTMHALAHAHFYLKDYTQAQEFSNLAIKARDRGHILFYHSVNLGARIYLAEDNTEDSVGLRLLIPDEMMEGLSQFCSEISNLECHSWDQVSPNVDIRGLLPWSHDLKALIPCTEREFSELLGKLGKDSMLGNPSSFQLVHVFAFLARPLSVLILLDRGADKNAKTDIGADLLHVACAGGDERLVQVLLERGFDRNAKIAKGRKMSPLMLAARAGHVKVLSVLAAEQINLEDTDEYGLTALFHAAGKGNVEGVQFLLEKGSRPQARDEKGWSPLHYAANNGRVQVILKLCAYGAEIDALDNDGCSSLWRAVTKDDEESVRALMRNGANATLRTPSGWTPFGAALAARKEEVARIMAEFGLDLRAPVEPSGRNASKFAADKNMDGIRRMLVNRNFTRSLHANGPVMESQQTQRPPNADSHSPLGHSHSARESPPRNVRNLGFSNLLSIRRHREPS